MNNKMTKAEREAYKARKNDLIKAGVDKTIAEVMARTEVQYGIIAPVVR